ncbi:MAG: zinc-binding dehydrogenase, partial [Halioglobus sp.]|nr:zinc-binding dehydrogenase [Halioglobus sp.]
SLGVERVIDYRRENIAEAVAQWAPDGVDFLMDAVGASTLPDALQLVRAGGTFVSIPTLVDDGDLAASAAAAARRGVNRVFSTMNDVGCAQTLDRILHLVARGEVRLPPLREFDLQDVRDAHSASETGHAGGKLILRVAEIGEA